MIFYTGIFALTAYIVWNKGKKFDQQVVNFFQRVTSRSPSLEEEQILWLQILCSTLRGGESLEQSLQKTAKQHPWRPDMQLLTREAIQGSKDNTLAILLHQAIREGTPCLDLLQDIRKQKTHQLKSTRKLQSLTSQVTVQAWVVGLMPWILFGALYLMDPTLTLSCINHRWAWILLPIALILDGVGIGLLRRLIARAFVPKDPDVKDKEEALYPLLCQLELTVAAGHDIEQSLLEISQKNGFRMGQWNFREALTLRHLIRNSLEHGSPILKELRSLKEDLEYQREMRWEKVLQILPIKILAPLFFCIFPAALCIIASLVIPMLSMI